MSPARITVRDDRGFTLVELLVAITILVVGLLGAFVMIDGANGVISTNNSRASAVDLGREVLEHAREVPYARLNPAQIAGELQRQSGLAGSGNPWTVTRRGVAYTLKVDVCTEDDPKDGLAATPPPNACPSAPAVSGAPVEKNPDDFRQVTATLTWQDHGTRTLTTNALIANPAGGLGPRLLAFPDQTTQIGTGATSVTWSSVAGTGVQTSGATSVRWVADDGASSGLASGADPNWAITWNLGTYGVGQYVPDGVYSVSAQAFDVDGIAGESRQASVLINRSAPPTPTALVGGRDARFGANGVVDLQWAAASDRDILGYRVYRLDGAVRTPICPATAGGFSAALSCTDSAPPAGTATYQVLGIDRTNLADSNSTLRESLVPATLTAGPAGAAPPAPTGLTVTTDPSSGQPRLTWTQGAATPAIRFFRIYRDTGTGLGDRYAATNDSTTSWSDASPGNTGHRYWVTAVDANFNESAPAGPVDWSAP